jgi:RHS repeat-associated protein
MRFTSILLALVGAVVSAQPGWAQTPAVAVEYYHLDAVGSVRAVTDASGNVVRRHDPLPFGDGAVEVAPGDDPLRFTGKPRDVETGLDYFGARYYASRSGQFTSVDPVLDQQKALLDPQRWNRYAYSLNNPLRHVDPDGRQVLDANLQKMLELLKSPKAVSKMRGTVIQTVTDLTVGTLLGELFGYPPRAARGGLKLEEYEVLMEASSHEKGATMLGVGEQNAPGIDAVDLTNAAGVSLKRAENATSLMRGAETALKQVEKAGFFNVRLYVHAKSVSVADVNQDRLRRFLNDRITKIVVFAKDGTVEVRAK